MTAAERYVMSLSVNPQQEKAIKHKDGPMMVLAGPGSGKTFVITRRLYYMITRHRIPPEQILVISFTRAAAAQMEERFLSLSGGAGRGITFGTFHAVYFSILKEVYHYGNDNILTEGDKRRYLREVIGGRRGVRDDEQTVEELLKEFSSLKNDGKAPDEYDESKGLVTKEDFKALFEEYHYLLRQDRRLDFDDMVLECRRLFTERPEVLKAFRQRYRYILIDEFQDINPQQYAVIKLLAGEEDNLFVVGDDDQSIYGFRSAEPGIMLNFPREHPGLARVLLSRNYRSAAGIVEASLRLIAHNRKRFSKRLSAERKGDKRVWSAEAGYKEEEAVLAVRLIRKAHVSIPYGSMAMLFRTHIDAGYYSRALADAGIPFYISESRGSVFRKSVGLDMLAIMAYAHGDHSRKNLLRFINKPPRYIRRAAFEGERAELSELLRDRTLKAAVAYQIRRLMEQLEFIRNLPPYGALMYIRREMGYEEWLKEDAAERGKDASEDIDYLKEICDSATDCRDYGAWLKKLSDYEDKLRDNERNKNADAVQLLTVHASKGLEYSMVIITDVNEGNFPQKKAVDRKALEEERRIFYVAMTRAKDRLFMLYLRKDTKNRTCPSRYLKEAKPLKLIHQGES